MRKNDFAVCETAFFCSNITCVVKILTTVYTIAKYFEADFK